MQSREESVVHDAVMQDESPKMTVGERSSGPKASPLTDRNVCPRGVVAFGVTCNALICGALFAMCERVLE